MMEEKKKHRIEITTISSKGQVVIPKAFRDAMKLPAGSPMAVDMHGDMLVMKPIRSPIQEEDLRILKEVKEAWEEIERGEYKSSRVEDFLREIKEW